MALLFYNKCGGFPASSLRQMCPTASLKSEVAQPLPQGPESGVDHRDEHWPGSQGSRLCSVCIWPHDHGQVISSLQASPAPRGC